MEGFVLDVAACPEDGGALERHDDAVRCARCGRTYIVDGGLLTLLPDRLAHLNQPEPEDRSGDQDVRWIEDELEWWNPWHEHETLQPLRPRSGLRGRSRERNLFRHVRDKVGDQPVVIEMGAGVSRTVAGLWPNGPRYVATDISLPALQAGRRLLGPQTASVQCDAVTWPFREGSADVVLILGVLHHLSDWRNALERACRTVRPGGFLLVHEAVTKPRVLARLRAGGMDDGWVSPHEGDVPATALRSELERFGEILHWNGEESPMRFGLVRYLVLRTGRHELLENSTTLTVAFNALDQAFGRGPGRLFPSLGFNEVTAVLQRSA